MVLVCEIQRTLITDGQHSRSGTNITEPHHFLIRDDERRKKRQKAKKKKNSPDTGVDLQAVGPTPTNRAPGSLVMRPGICSLTAILSRPCESAVKAKARILAEETGMRIQSECTLCCVQTTEVSSAATCLQMC